MYVRNEQTCKNIFRLRDSFMRRCRRSSFEQEFVLKFTFKFFNRNSFASLFLKKNNGIYFNYPPFSVTELIPRTRFLTILNWLTDWYSRNISYSSAVVVAYAFNDDHKMFFDVTRTVTVLQLYCNCTVNRNQSRRLKKKQLWLYIPWKNSNTFCIGS